MSLSEARLLDEIRQRLFSPQTSDSPHTIGVELELIPVHVSTRLPALPREQGSGSTVAVLSNLARTKRWTEHPVENDPPSWTLADGARISFEPGGQLEISSAPNPTASSVIRAVQNVVTTIRPAMKSAGIELLAAGVDPFNDIDVVPLQLLRDRYARMTRFFDSIGPSGIKMMRQTAAVQINVERGSAPAERWSLLNALAPYVVAVFANSRSYAGKTTDQASFRAHLWRTLDPSRTGLPYAQSDPAKRYLSFALDAKAMRSSDTTRPRLSFREWMRAGDPDEEEWLFHLSTLFPEVRPKEFFEIRSADAVDSEWLAAPVVFVVGLVYDNESASRARDIVGEPSEELLERAGRAGLADPEIHRITSELARLALSGAQRLGEMYLSQDDLGVARTYFERKLQLQQNES
jgi:glutamate--cysteine ligase